MKRYFFCLIVVLSVLLYSCNSPYGKRVKINDRIEVYIKNGATEDEAKIFGNYIDTVWKGATNQKSFQLSKDSGQYTVRMVVDENKIKADSSLDVSFIAIQFLLEQQVFKSSKVRLILTDDHFKDLKAFESTATDSNRQDKNVSDSEK